MAQSEMFAVQLSRPNSSVSWGFRLQGGADFSTPLSIQLVQPGSVAEECGLLAGDGILQINGVATETLEHETAKMEIIRAGNEVEFLIQRGAVTTWRPRVTPMSELKPTELQTHALPGEAPPIQKTSLAANKQSVQHIGSAHNRSAQPFGAATNTGRVQISPERHISIRDSFPDAHGHPGAYRRNELQSQYLDECQGYKPDVNYDVNQSIRQNPNAAPGVVHAQYNTPIGMYSNKNLNEAFDQQTHVMKNEFGNMRLSDEQVGPAKHVIINNNNNELKPLPAALESSRMYEMRKSPVMTALEQEEQEPALYKGGKIQSRSFKLLEQELQEGADVGSVFSGQPATNRLPSGVRSVQAPKTNMKMAGPRWKQPTTSCYVCGNPITGVFVRVKDYCLHSDCLRCAQCKRSLKNIGYIWVKDNIYCLQHARELTRPPGGGYTAYVIDAPEGM